MLEQIEKANDEEQAEYGEQDLEEMGGHGTSDMDGKRLKHKIEELNQRLREKVRPPEQEKNARQALKELESDCLPRQEKNEEQTKVLAGRNCYSKTDPDATCMRMKEDRGPNAPGPNQPTTSRWGRKGSSL